MGCITSKNVPASKDITEHLPASKDITPTSMGVETPSAAPGAQLPGSTATMVTTLEPASPRRSTIPDADPLNTPVRKKLCSERRIRDSASAPDVVDVVANLTVQQLLLLRIGGRVFSKFHGHGEIIEIHQNDARGKPYYVQYMSGDFYCYSQRSAVQLLAVPMEFVRHIGRQINAAYQTTCVADGPTHGPLSPTIKKSKHKSGGDFGALRLTEMIPVPEDATAAIDNFVSIAIRAAAQSCTSPSNSGQGVDIGTALCTDVASEPAASSSGNRMHLETCRAFRFTEDAQVQNGMVNQYRTGKVLGKGSFSKVLQAWDEDDAKEVALKVISLKHIVANPTGSSHTGVSVESIKASLRNDIWALRSLSHPSCATMLEVIEDASGLMLYIVLEYGTAGTLHDAEDLELGLVRTYAQELLLALQYLHSCGVAHRDIKPENVLLTADGHAKLTDFGLASLVRSDDNQIKTSQVITYFAPEMVLSNVSSSAQLEDCDIWAFGVTMYFAVFGQLPFGGASLPEVVFSILQGSIGFPEPSDSKFEDFIKRVLCKNPENRPSLHELLGHAWVCGG